jgi:hypothetical protein
MPSWISSQFSRGNRGAVNRGREEVTDPINPIKWLEVEKKVTVSVG